VIDATKSARPVFRYLAGSEIPVAVFHVPREVQYGLGFYFNREIPSYDAGNFPQQEHFLVTKKDDFKELIQIMRERAIQRQGTRVRCSEESVLRPDTSFRSPVFDLYRVSVQPSCIEIFPAAGGIDSGKK
jgi:hypothetical protein